MKKTQIKSFSTGGGANLVGGGDLTESALIAIRQNDLPIFCADAGLLAAQSAGLTVQGVIGDMDTVGKADVDSVHMAFIPGQDTTDFDKSLALIDARYILCFGFLGGRMDHSLASFSSITKVDKPAFLIDEVDVCAVCPPHLALNLPIGTRLSIYPLVPTTARSTGLAYNLDDVALSPIGMVSTSNTTATTHVQVWIDSGVALVIFPRGELQTVLDQWPFSNA